MFPMFWIVREIYKFDELGFDRDELRIEEDESDGDAIVKHNSKIKIQEEQRCWLEKSTWDLQRIEVEEDWKIKKSWGGGEIYHKET